MLENNFGSNFCLKVPTVKNQDGARTIYMRVTVNRPRDTIPTQICPPSQSNVKLGKIKNSKPSKELRFSFNTLMKQLRDEGQ